MNHNPSERRARRDPAGAMLAIGFGIFWAVVTYAVTWDLPFPRIVRVLPYLGLLFVGYGVFALVVHLWPRRNPGSSSRPPAGPPGTGPKFPQS